MKHNRIIKRFYCHRKKCLWLSNTLFVAFEHFVCGFRTLCLRLSNTLYVATIYKGPQSEAAFALGVEMPLAIIYFTENQGVFAHTKEKTASYFFDISENALNLRRRN